MSSKNVQNTQHNHGEVPLVHGGQKVIDSAIILLCCIFGSAISLIASIILTKI
jgi:hypothetical protein